MVIASRDVQLILEPIVIPVKPDDNRFIIQPPSATY